MRDIFLIPLGRKCCHTATAWYCARLRLYWYNGQY